MRQRRKTADGRACPVAFDCPGIARLERKMTEMDARYMKRFQEVEEKVEAIRMVKINGGGAVTLDVAITMLLNATRRIRLTNRLVQAFDEWKAGTKIGMLFATKAGKALFLFVGLFFILSALHALGLEQFDPLGLCGKLCAYIVKIL